VEIWVVGAVVDDDGLRWLTGNGATFEAYGRVSDAFWSRQLNGMAPYREESRRAYLLFEVVTWSGTAFREPRLWNRICAEEPWACSRRARDAARR
jgi:hypothetical protein